MTARWFLLEGTTIELAKQSGAMWVRDLDSNRREMFYLPAGYFKNWTSLPPAELAYIMFRKMQYEKEETVDLP